MKYFSNTSINIDRLTLGIIGASYLQRPLVEKAKELGLRTICFAWTEGAVCKDICDVFYPISVVEKEKILRICQQEKIDGICKIASDVAAPTVAYVANHMGLVGNSYIAAVRATNKYAMLQTFMTAGVSCPRYRYIRECDKENIQSLISDIQTSMSLPLIVKPTDRSGSLAVTKITEWTQLSSALALALDTSFLHEAIIEEFVDGREISVEFISYKGKHYPLQITDKVTTNAPHFVELEHHQPADFPAVMYERIYTITERALNALEVTNGASHSEYKITDDGRIVIMELGARMGGDFIGSDLVQLSTGYDFVRGVIDVALGDFCEKSLVFNRSLSEAKHCGIYFLCKETEYLMPIFEHWQDYAEIVACERTNEELKNVTCSGDRSGYFIYQESDDFVLRKCAK